MVCNAPVRESKLLVVAAAWTLSTLVAGCTGGSSGGGPLSGAASSITPAQVLSPAASATSAGPGSSSSTIARVIVVGISDVAGIPMGTPGEEAERLLRRELGPPSSVAPVPDCGGEVGRRLTWGTLTVETTDEARGGMPRMDAWNVRAGRSQLRLQLPYGISPGRSIRDVLARVPEAKEFTLAEFPGSYSVGTPRAPSLHWSSSTGDKTGVVSEVAYRGVGCE